MLTIQKLKDTFSEYWKQYKEMANKEATK